jgi:UDP-N-acetylmuramoyl-tripeptide--D-alanyl-D-alanine ligase
MIPMSLPAIAEVVGGVVHDDPDGVTVTGPAFLDSRKPEPGGLFAAFAGEQADGHEYAARAVAGGAAAVLAARPVGVPAVVVADQQEALGALAHHVLEALPQVRVLGVTGSQGKTSTKDMLAAVLAAEAPTVATRGSFNNELGLPLTVLRADEHTSHLLLEMGARGLGHLRALCAIARPDVSLVLNVGKAHLGEFGTQADIATAKGELVEALDADGVAVLNADDPLVAAMARRTTARVLTFGSADGADVRLQDLRLDEQGRPAFSLVHEGDAVELSLQLIGEHQARNAAAAAGAAVAVGIPLREACRVLAQVKALSQWRMEVHHRADGVTVVNDAYNANPDSMEAALRALVAIGERRTGEARTIAVLGEMRELGESSDAEHEAVGRLAVRLGVHQLLVVGEAARAVERGARAERPDSGLGEEPVFVADNDDAVGWLTRSVRPGDVVLVKASRGARLDVVGEALLEAVPDTGLDAGEAGR